MTLLHLQPSDGTPKRGYITFFELYGNNLERIKPERGDVCRKENGVLILLYDRTHYFQMHTDNVEPNQSYVTCHFYTYPKPGDKWPRGLRKAGPVPNPEVTRALAYALADKFLPFHPIFCNKHAWMQYILYGELNPSEAFKECPLMAPFTGVTGEQISTGNFKLLDSFGNEHDFSEYDLPRQSVSQPSQRGGKSPEEGGGSGSSKQKRPLSEKQGSKSESNKRTQRNISLEQRQSTFSRMVSKGKKKA